MVIVTMHKAEAARLLEVSVFVEPGEEASYASIDVCVVAFVAVENPKGCQFHPWAE